MISLRLFVTRFGGMLPFVVFYAVKLNQNCKYHVQWWHFILFSSVCYDDPDWTLQGADKQPINTQRDFIVIITNKQCCL